MAKRITIKIIFYAALLLGTNAFAQNRYLDSLQQLIKNNKADTNTVKRLNKVGLEFCRLAEFDSALKYSEKGLLVAKQLKFTWGEALIYSTISLCYINKGNFPAAKECAIKSMTAFEQSHDMSNTAYGLTNIGLICTREGDYSEALGYCLKGLQMGEIYCTKEDLPYLLNSVASIYFELRNYSKVIEYCKKQLKIAEETNNKYNISAALSGIGVGYAELNNNKMAEQYYVKSLAIKRALGDELDIAGLLSNMANVTEDRNKALEMYLEALEIKKKHKDRNGMSNVMSNIGNLYTAKKDFKLAETYLLKAIALQKEIGSMDFLSDALRNMTNLYVAKKDFKNAYVYRKEYIQVKDSLYNIEKENDITRKELNYEFDKKETAAKAEYEKQMALAEADKQRQKLFFWFIAAIAASISFIALIVFRSLRIAKKQKGTIEHQKHLLEVHQKEIIDSITYAKRIQDAILPPLELIRQKLPNSFVLYKPKDIVAGDFYWMEEFDGYIFIAAADCTGHGVPGAMVSVVCSNALTRAVKEFGLRDSGKILDKTNELVLETFEKSANNVKDGMDISFLAINKQEKKILWSGANNPLWYISGDEFNEIKADKQPIGKTEFFKPFTRHEIEYTDGVTFYLFTDGLADQFGGPKGKKFKYKQFSDLLLNINTQNVIDQIGLIDKSLSDWKGRLEQVDDVCVIGIRI